MVWGRYPQGPLSPLYRAYTHASPNSNGLNPNVTVGMNSAGIATLGIYMLSYYLSIGGMGTVPPIEIRIEVSGDQDSTQLVLTVSNP